MTRSRDPEAGLTLIEVLVALAIVGVMTGMTVLSLDMLDRGGRAQAEAMRLADRLRLASDQALLSGSLLALVWNARGYRFLRWDAGAGAWQEDPLPLLGASHRLPSALRLERPELEGDPPVLISFDPPQPPVRLQVSGSQDRWAVTFDGLDAVVADLGPPDD